MNELTLDQIKRKELELLNAIDSFCKENSISYSLTGGTLLGAVRHKGFIPWDDDIDLLMRRSDYEKFLKIMSDKKPSGLRLLSYTNSDSYNYLFAKVCDCHTSLYEEHNKKIEGLGVYVDIFPVDYLGDTREEALRLLKKCRYTKYLGVAFNWQKFYLNGNKSWKRQIPRLFFYLASRRCNIKKRYKKLEDEVKTKPQTAYSGCLCGSYDKREVMPSFIFDDRIELEFEGRQYPCLKQYDIFLKTIYGDYMTLPPEEKRITHHMYKAYEN